MSHIPATVSRHLDTIEFDKDGGLLLSASSLTNRYWTGSLWYYDEPEAAPDVERCAAGVDIETGVTDIQWIPDTSRFIAGSDSGTVSLWELADQKHTIKCVAHPREHDDSVTSVSIMAGATQAVSASQDNRIKVWDISEFTSIAVYKAHYDIVRCVACHPTQQSTFISCSQDGRMLLWDTRKPKPASFVDTSFLGASAACVAWQPGREHSVVIGTEAGSLVLQDTRWSVGTPAVIAAHSRYITRLAFSPHRSDWVAAASEDCSLSVSDTSAAKVVYKDSGHRDFVRGLAWHPVSQQLWSCSWDFSLRHSTVQEQEALSSPLATMDIREVSPPTNSSQPMDTTPTSASSDLTSTPGSPHPNQPIAVEAKG